MLHRLFSAATSAAARKGKSLAVEEEEIAKSKQLLFGYLPEGPTEPVMEARVLILKDEAGRKDKVFLYDSHGDQVALQNGRFSPLPKRTDRDLEAITEYMYGAIPLSYKGITTKMHLIPLSNQTQAGKALLFTRLFTVRGLDEGQWTAGGSLSSSWGSNTSSSSTGAPLNPGFPFPRMTPITKQTPPPQDRPARVSVSPTSPLEHSVAHQRAQTPGERFTSGWFPSPSPIIFRGPLQRLRTPFKSPSPDQTRKRVRGTTMFAVGIVIPVISEADVNSLIQGDSYATLRRAIEELVRDIHERLETGEYKIDFTVEVERFLTRLKDGLGVLQKVPLPWRGSEDMWRDLILSVSSEIDARFLAVLMSNILVDLSNRLNTPPASPMHPSSPSGPPPTRLLILSSSASTANRLTTMLLPFLKAVYPPNKHPKKVLPKAPKLQILPPSKPRADSSQSSHSSRPSITRDSTRNVDLPRRSTHPSIYQRRDTWKSPPTLSLSQTSAMGNPSSVSSWFGSWIRRGGPLAASNPSPGQAESCSPFSPRASDHSIDVRRESEQDLPPLEVDVIKDSTGEVIDVRLTTSFQTSRRRSSSTLPEDYDLKRRGSMTLNNVAYVDDTFRVTGYHTGKYHVDYHLQSMERTDDVEADVFRALNEDVLYFFTPPIHAMPVNPIASPPLPRISGPRKVGCVIADLDTLEIHKLSVSIDDDEELREREQMEIGDEEKWKRIREWAIDGTSGIDNFVKDILA